MDIAGLSMVMSQYKVQNAAGISILKMAMNTSRENAAAMTDMIKDSAKEMQRLAEPHLGNYIDVSV